MTFVASILVTFMFVFRCRTVFGLAPSSLLLVGTGRRLNHSKNPRHLRLVRRMLSSESSIILESCPLPFETLPYRGASVRLDRQQQQQQQEQPIPTCNEEFLKKLQLSIDFWKQNDYNSAWLHIHTSRAALIESLQHQVDDGDYKTNNISFDLHHVNATENTIVLKKWLRSEPSEDKIPPFATHQVGCAGFVLSDDNELLLIKEWTRDGGSSCSNRTKTKQWKLPGGLLDYGETFGEASCREVFEETGIRCDFESILAFWHRHGLMFGKSDFYYVCLLRPLNKDINIDPVEVSDAIWMPVQEFLETQNHPLIHHVLKHAFDLDKDQPPLPPPVQQTRLKPIVEMLEGHVQFTERRPPFLTYTGRTDRR